MLILESGILGSSTSDMLNVCLPPLSTLIKRIFSSLDKPMDNAFSFSGSTGANELGGLLAGVDTHKWDVLIVTVDAELDVLVFVFAAAEEIFSNSPLSSFFSVSIFPSVFPESAFFLWMSLPCEVWFSWGNWPFVLSFRGLGEFLEITEDETSFSSMPLISFALFLGQIMLLSSVFILILISPSLPPSSAFCFLFLSVPMCCVSSVFTLSSLVETVMRLVKEAVCVVVSLSCALSDPSISDDSSLAVRISVSLPSGFSFTSCPISSCCSFSGVSFTGSLRSAGLWDFESVSEVVRDGDWLSGFDEGVGSDSGEKSWCSWISGPNSREEEYFTPLAVPAGVPPNGPPRHVTLWPPRKVARLLKTSSKPVLWWRSSERREPEFLPKLSSSSFLSSSESCLVAQERSHSSDVPLGEKLASLPSQGSSLKSSKLSLSTGGGDKHWVGLGWRTGLLITPFSSSSSSSPRTETGEPCQLRTGGVFARLSPISWKFPITATGCRSGALRIPPRPPYLPCLGCSKLIEQAVVSGSKALNKREGSVSSGFAFRPFSEWDETTVDFLLFCLGLVLLGRDCISCFLREGFGRLLFFLGILWFSDFEDGCGEVQLGWGVFVDGLCVLSPRSLLTLCLCLDGDWPWFSGDRVVVSILLILASPEELEVEMEVNNSFSVALLFKPTFLSLFADLSLFFFLSAILFSSFFLRLFLSSPFLFVFWTSPFLSLFTTLSDFLCSSNSLSGLFALDLLWGDCREQRGCEVFLYLTSENLDFWPAWDVVDVWLARRVWFGLPWSFCCPVRPGLGWWMFDGSFLPIADV